MTQMKNARNKHECEALADAIDTLLLEGEVSENSVGLEKLLRRLAGVHLADTMGNWSVCGALQWSGPNQSLLSRNSLTSALKQAAQYESLTRRLNSASRNNNTNNNNNSNYGYRQRTNNSFRPSSTFRGGRGGNNNNNNYYNNNRNNNSSGTSSSSGSANKQ